MLTGSTDPNGADIRPGQPVYCSLLPGLTAEAADPEANNLPPGSIRINAKVRDEQGQLEAEHRRTQELVYPPGAAEARVADRFDDGMVELTLAVVQPAHRKADVDRLLVPDHGLPRRVMLAPLDIFDVRLVDLPEAS